MSTIGKFLTFTTNKDRETVFGVEEVQFVRVQESDEE